MRIIETKVYQFSELSEQAKAKAIERLYNINVYDEWWDFTYDDAKNVGLKITAFDLDRGSYVKADFINDAMFTANAIIKEHGDERNTFKTAQDYLIEYKALIAEQCQQEADDFCDIDRDDYAWKALIQYEPDEIDTEDIDKEFLHMLCEDYRFMLAEEYDYRTSDEEIIEAIEANEYEFTEEGRLI